jgi:uncharacterized membrane protein
VKVAHQFQQFPSKLPLLQRQTNEVPPMIPRLFQSLALALATISSFGQTAPSFQFVSIDFPGASDTTATGINNSGVIVGSYTLNGVIHGYKLVNGHFTTINFPGAVSTQVNGINTNGDIAGTYFPAAINTSHGFLLHKGVFKSLSFPGAHQTSANGVNNALKIVGQADNDGFTWQNGAFHRFKAPSNANGTTALNGISNLGLIVGQVFDLDNWRAFLLNGSDLDLLQPGGALDNMARGVNGRGDVVGCHAASGFLIFHPEAGESSTDKPDTFPTLISVNFPGASNSCNNSINYSQSIVGTYSDSGFHNHGFLAIRR